MRVIQKLLLQKKTLNYSQSITRTATEFQASCFTSFPRETDKYKLKSGNCYKLREECVWKTSTCEKVQIQRQNEE